RALHAALPLVPALATEPLSPRPAVLPRPEPMPRPTRVRSLRAPSAGLRVFRRMGFSLLLDPHQVVELVDEAADLRAVLQLADVVELVQAQGADRQTVTGLGAAQAAHQAHLDGLVGLVSH